MGTLKNLLRLQTIILSLCWFLALPVPLLEATSFMLPPPIEAQAAIVMEANSQMVLYEKEAERQMFPASTTKIMTFLLAQKLGSPESVVTVSSRAALCEGSSLEVTKGDRIKLRDLTYGLMLVSGNDAAEAVAEHIGGSIPGFVQYMNSEAAAIGAKHTHFVNPHGLPDPNHYTTAYDLALITARALRTPEFSLVSGTKKATVAFLDGGTRSLVNTNKLLGNYRGINGGKTGYTRAAGDCLVATAKRAGVQLIVVILNSDERWDDAKALLDFGFALKGVS